MTDCLPDLRVVLLAFLPVSAAVAQQERGLGEERAVRDQAWRAVAIAAAARIHRGSGPIVLAVPDSGPGSDVALSRFERDLIGLLAPEVTIAPSAQIDRCRMPAVQGSRCRVLTIQQLAVEQEPTRLIVLWRIADELGRPDECAGYDLAELSVELTSGRTPAPGTEVFPGVWVDVVRREFGDVACR